jgi:hypothetical protein
MKKKTVLFSILLILCSQVAKATTAIEQRAVEAGYGAPEDIEPTICDQAKEFEQMRGPCQALLDRMHSGHLVSEREVNGWCGPMQQYRNAAMRYAADYKKVYGKAFDFKRCGSKD